jgi:hypothetical protein
MPRRSFLDYFSEVQASVISRNVGKGHTLRPTTDGRNKWKGAISGEIFFPKGGKLRINEQVEINPSTDRVNILKYSYSYIGEYKGNSNFFFRYEMDTAAAYHQDGTKRIYHPEFHLHANDHDMRYMTHKTSFTEVLDFILACFYSQKKTG